MGFNIWDTPSGRDRRWMRRKSYAPAPTYARVAVVLLAATLVLTLAWQGVQRLLHPATTASEAPRVSALPLSDAPGVPAWQSAVSDALKDAAAQGAGENITAAEMQTDRAAAILITTRMQGQAAAPDFFERCVRELDGVLRTHPENERLLEHVTLVRIELAQLRSAQPDAAPGSGSADGGALKNQTAGHTVSPATGVEVGPGTQAPHAINIPGHVMFAAPRALAANELLDPAALRGNYIDASLMPDTSEILLPPATRAMTDGVRVDGFTIHGATQTLDGVRWKDVTFIGTRLRYEGGKISLQSVRFTNCTFGFTTDERGARLADAIALGRRSFKME
jgi:hypothetical protein